MNKLTKVLAFIQALTELSKEHGIWIDANENIKELNLVDENLSVIALDIRYDENTQTYSVKEDFEAIDKLN